MAPTRRDLLLCIRTHHPTTAISNSNYYKHAKSCLAHVLPGSPEKELEETSTTFVDAVRRRYKKARHFDRFKDNPWFDCELKLKSPPVPPPVPTPPKPPTSPKRVVTRKLSFEQKKKNMLTSRNLLGWAALEYFKFVHCSIFKWNACIEITHAGISRMHACNACLQMHDCVLCTHAKYACAQLCACICMNA